MKSRIEKIWEQPLTTLLGGKKIFSEGGVGKIYAEVNANTINPSGFYHGGAVYALSDVCAMCALSSLLEEEKEAVTHDIQVSMMRPAVADDEVLYEASVIKLGKRIAFMDVTVTVNEQIIATARVTKSII